jgi:hypothetical protein
VDIALWKGSVLRFRADSTEGENLIEDVKQWSPNTTAIAQSRLSIQWPPPAKTGNCGFPKTVV